MATMITSSTLVDVTPGERRLGQRLRSHLEDDYIVWFNVPVGRTRRYPDFVILHPRHGLLVLEVKDWRAQSIRSVDKLRWELDFNGAITTKANPLEQARQYMMELVNDLQRDPHLCEQGSKYKGNLCFPYGWGVVLPNITRKQWDEMLTEEEQNLVLPSHRVICQDEMTEATDPLAFQERLWGMFEYRFKGPMTLPQMDRVRWHIFPEVRIQAPVQGDLFVNETTPDIVQVLDLQQEQLARNLGAGHRVIHGVAGSGKTLILGYRCTQLAQVLSSPALVLCYNISLAAKLRCLVEAEGIADRIHVRHFHAWCGEMLECYNVEVEDGKAPYWERQVSSVIKGVEDGHIPRGQYDAVMIDEGHDFQPEWLQLVTQMVNPNTDSLLLLYDDAQSIYRKKKTLGFSLSSVGIKAAGRTTILRLNYRNTAEILHFAYDFAKEYLHPATADEDHVPLLAPQASGPSGPIPQFIRATSLTAEFDHAVRCVRYWLDKGVPAHEIAIICFRNSQGDAISKRLATAGISHLWMCSPKAKRAYDAFDEKVTVILAPSSKGLEFQSVAIVGVGQLEDSDEQREEHTRLLYVAMTRARRQLALCASGDNAYVQRLSSPAVA